MSKLYAVCHCCVADGVPRRSLIYATIIGTILNLINQGDVLFGDAHLNVTKLLLTFAVPYISATYGAVSFRLRYAGRPELQR
ncbi:MAG: nitrate/nitrite transporter NrtS [Rhizomicrobium sp.]